MKTINRRETPRIDLNLRCHISSPAFRIRSVMFTENISRNGLLIAWRGHSGLLPVPAVGQIITVDVELPAEHEFGPRCIHCQGAVIRITKPHPDYPTVAMRVNYMAFRSFHDRLHNMELLHTFDSAWTA